MASLQTLAHTPVAISRAIKIPEARSAVDKEWEQIEKHQRGVRQR